MESANDHACQVELCFKVGRLTEGFYDTALNEASEPELQAILPNPARVAKHGRFAEGHCVKTMLCAA